MGNELWHHGTKDMRWGVRRYQNLDGTLTAEGKLRYQKRTARVNRSKGATTALKSGSDALSKTSELVSEQADKKKQKGEEKYKRKKQAAINKMSDKELKDYINRRNLEKQYMNLKLEDRPQQKSGAEKVGEILAYAGAVTAIGASTVGIISGIRSMKVASYKAASSIKAPAVFKQEPDGSYKRV